VSTAAILEHATTLGLGLLTLALVLCLVRLARGPSLADRILALDTMTTLGAGYIAVIAVRTGIMLYLDIAIALALVGFLSTVALARYLLQRAGGKADGS
jgi:multicomponent Na+:H+ antiporter subunit F